MERLQRSGSRSTALLLERDKAAVVAVSRPCAPGPADHIAPRDSFVNGRPTSPPSARVAEALDRLQSTAADTSMAISAAILETLGPIPPRRRWTLVVRRHHVHSG
jgi:hypothetical protein